MVVESWISYQKRNCVPVILTPLGSVAVTTAVGSTGTRMRIAHESQAVGLGPKTSTPAAVAGGAPPARVIDPAPRRAAEGRAAHPPLGRLSVHGWHAAHRLKADRLRRGGSGRATNCERKEQTGGESREVAHEHSLREGE